MRYTSIILLLSVLFACTFNQSKNKDSSNPVKYALGIDSANIAKIRLGSYAEYRGVLDTIDPGDLASLGVAGTLFKNCIADTLQRDSMFLAFDDFINHLAGTYFENNQKVSNQLANAPSRQTFNSLTKIFGDHGMLLYSLEGSFYLEPQIKFLLQNFGSSLSPAYREFLTIESEEQERLFARDGNILIKGDSLISRIIRWDQFMEKNPGFVSIKSAQDKYSQYLGAFLAGMENSKVFDPDTNILKDSSKTSFESLIEKYPGTRSSEVVQKYLELLRSTDFGYTDKVDSFLLKKVYGLEMEEELK